MSKALNHAVHNEEACKYLSATEQFPDWRVTTAFYSAVHYVNHKLFPGKIPINGKEIECKNFADYYSKIPHEIKANIHRTTINLVWICIKDIGADYERLFDLCYDARYHNYKISKGKADLAQQLLVKIRSICIATSSVTPVAAAATPGED